MKIAFKLNNIFKLSNKYFNVKSIPNLNFINFSSRLPKYNFSNRFSRGEDDNEGQDYRSQDRRNRPSSNQSTSTRDQSSPDDDKSKVFVRSLAYGTTKEDLYGAFEKYGELEDIVIPFDKMTGQLKTFAFVKFKDENVTNKVIEMQTLNINGREVSLNKSFPRGSTPTRQTTRDASSDENQVVVKNLPFDVTSEDVNEFFKNCGEISKINMPQGNESVNRGFCFVQFQSPEMAKRALLKSGEEINGRKVNVKPYENVDRGPSTRSEGMDRRDRGGERREYRSESVSSSQGSDAYKVFIGNLNFQVDEGVLRNYFGKCGEIDEVRVPTGENQPNRGFAFVKFRSKEAFENAISLDGQPIEGRNANIRPADSKPRSSPRRNSYNPDENF
jgi:RNA recognition motif-containing protein